MLACIIKTGLDYGLLDYPGLPPKNRLMAEDISIFGQVRGYDATPIAMIQVTVYRDSFESRELAHEYTDQEGKYRISVPPGTPITVRFDTHYSLTNAQEWHPS